MARGGLKFMRGAVADYVAYFTDAKGKGCADHGYYGEGELWNVSAVGMIREAEFTAQAYGNWLDGRDPQSGIERGESVRQVGDGRCGVRGYEFGVNVPKSASIVASIDPELGKVLMRAQERAAVVGVEGLRARATTRVGARGNQTFESVDSLEVAVFAHDGSREGDPHHHLHVQVGSKVFVAGKWRSIYGPGLVRSLREWQANVSGVLATDPEWVSACGARGLTVGPDGGINEISAEMEQLFSKRHVAIVAKKELLLQDFRVTWGRSPGAVELIKLDQLAWDVTRPKKGEHEILTREQVAQVLTRAGYENLVQQVNAGSKKNVAGRMLDPVEALGKTIARACELGVMAEGQLTTLAAEGMNDAGGIVEDFAATRDAITEKVARGCVTVELPQGRIGLIRNEVFAAAVQVQEYVTVAGAAAQPHAGAVLLLDRDALTPGQVSVAEAVAAGLPVVVEGAAGTGKTFALRRALDARNAAGLNTFGLASTSAAVEQLGEGWTQVSTVHGLLTRLGLESAEAGEWVTSKDGWVSSELREALRDAVIVVDEAAMLDLHTMSALTKVASAHGSRIILVGDDRQLGAVGLAGGFTLATQNSEVIEMREAVRFSDPNHADLVAKWRASGDIESIIEDAISAGNVVVHDSEDDAHVALAQAASEPDVLVMCPDNASAARINTLVRAENEAAGRVGESVGIYGREGEPMGVGDKIQTRLNDREVGVNNRQQWIIDAITADGSMNVHRAGRAADKRTLPDDYVKNHVQRADVVTVHAAQGATSESAHALLDSSWTREQAYVALTRGRGANTLHVVAADIDEVRGVLREVLHSSDRARGVALSDAVRSHTLAASPTVKAPTKETRALRVGRRDEARLEAFPTMGARMAEAVKMPAKQASVQVRVALAKLPWSTPAMLRYLTSDTDPSVRATALREAQERGLVSTAAPVGTRAVEIAPVPVVQRDVPTI